MYIGLVELEVFSGISVFQPFSSVSAPTYPLPPPTTLLGALAYPYLTRTQKTELESLDRSPAAKLLERVLYATAGAENYIATHETERVYQMIYQRKDRWDLKDYWYTVGVRGVVSYLDDKLYIMYVAKDESILRYAYGISRIGRKEGHVAVNRVVIKPLRDILRGREGTTIRTIFYVPCKLAVCENANRMIMPILTEQNFTTTTKLITEEFYIPSDGIMKCTLGKEGVSVEVEGFEIAIPKSLVSER